MFKNFAKITFEGSISYQVIFDSKFFSKNLIIFHIQLHKSAHFFHFKSYFHKFFFKILKSELKVETCGTLYFILFLSDKI